MGLAINGLAHPLEVVGGDGDDRVGVRAKDLVVDDVCAAGGEGGQDADQGRPHHAPGLTRLFPSSFFSKLTKYHRFHITIPTS